MRIISGQFKGRMINVPQGIRPTEDRVRKAFFDIIGDIKDLSFLELFAGSGAMGLEALSLGAAELVFVEKDREAVKTIQDNLKSLLGQDTLRSKTEVIPLDVFQAIPLLAKNGKRFDLIFLDPPYYKGIAEKILQTLEDYVILSPLGCLGIQHFKKDRLPESQGKLVLFKQTRYGDTLLSFYRQEG
jgi:16S rRNA (guanine(966)-N(2))-methyltransferase RsmD